MTIKKAILAIVSIITIIVIFFMGKVMYQKYDQSRCPTSVRTEPLVLPEYQNAEQLTIKKEVLQGDFYTKHFEFFTSDPPTMVISFYTTELQADGWDVDQEEGGTALGFAEETALPRYYLTLYVKPVEKGTNVEIIFSYQPCILA